MLGSDGLIRPLDASDSSLLALAATA
jgi:hypothetical protein